MMKHNKKEYPVSVFKVHVHDLILDRLDWIREKLEVKNNVEAFAICVNGIYNQLHALDEYHKKGEIVEEVPTELLQGVEDSAEGKTVDRGSFKQYVEEDDKEC